MSRILIAEDEPRITSFLERGLGAAGFGTVVAADGVAAYEQARGGAFDLMILDIGLPLRDGFTVPLLRQERVTLPVIILTARDGVGDTVVSLEEAPTTTSPSRSPSRNCSPGCGSGFAPTGPPSPHCSRSATWPLTCARGEPTCPDGRSSSPRASSPSPKCSAATPTRC